VKQHFTKVFLASMLLVIAPLTSAKIANAEDAIPDEIQALLPSDDGSSDAASQEAEFLSEFGDDDSGVALSNADVDVVIMSDDNGSSASGSSSNGAGASNNAGGFAGGSAASNGVQVAALDGVPQEILDILAELFGDDGGDNGNGEGGEGGEGEEEEISNIVTDELVTQYDDVAFSSDFYNHSR